MKYKDFTDFLKDKFPAEGVLDDEMEDAFDYWLSKLEVQELIDYADEFRDDSRVEYLGHENKD